MLYATVYTYDEETGTKTVGRVEVRDGTAEPTTERLRDFLAETNIMLPVDAGGPRVIEPEEGVVYVTALPYTLRGPNIWAELGHAV